MRVLGAAHCPGVEELRAQALDRLVERGILDADGGGGIFALSRRVARSRRYPPAASRRNGRFTRAYLTFSSATTYRRRETPSSSACPLPATERLSKMAQAKKPSPRFYDLDALRAVAMFMIIVAHSSVFILPEQLADTRRRGLRRLDLQDRD